MTTIETLSQDYATRLDKLVTEEAGGRRQCKNTISYLVGYFLLLPACSPYAASLVVEHLIVQHQTTPTPNYSGLLYDRPTLSL